MRRICFGNIKRDEFHNRIASFRKARGYSQEELSRLVGISRNSISSIETETFQPTAYTAGLICKALGCSFEDLFYYEIKLDDSFDELQNMTIDEWLGGNDLQ